MCRLRNFLFICLALCVCASCGTFGSPTGNESCDLASQEDKQRATGYKRNYYSPRVYSRVFSRDLGADISPTDADYNIARAVSRSVFELEFRQKENPNIGGTGTGWLIAPRYVATAAHNVARNKDSSTEICEAKNVSVYVHTFDGETIKVKEVSWFDNRCERGTDLALLELEREIDAVPMKIAERGPRENEMLMAMGYASDARELGAWTVTAGPALTGRVYHWVPTSPGMSGGPIFNREGEVVSIVSAGGVDDPSFERGSFMKNPELLNLWVYGFHQKEKNFRSWGPNPAQLRKLYGRVPGLSVPGNAGEYPDNNEWEDTEHALNDNYSPFPIDQFDHMNEVFKQARKATVEITGMQHGYGFGGSGFIYDDGRVITAGHVVQEQGQKVTITTTDGREHAGTVSKIQQDEGNLDGCDIAVIKTDTQNVLSEYPKLEIGNSSSLECGDPLVQIGYGNRYNGVGGPQGLATVYMTTRKYTSEFLSYSSTAGLSGGPVVDRGGEVITLSSSIYHHPSDNWDEPGPLYIHTRMPVYVNQEASNGPSAEIIGKFITEEDFYCQ